MKKKNLAVVKWFVLALTLVTMFGMSMTVMAASPKPALNRKKVTMTVGKTFQLKVKNNKKKVTWSSSKKSVATVTKKGKVKAVKAGKTVVTAKVAGKKLKCKVTVRNADAKAYELSFAINGGGEFAKGASTTTVKFKLRNTSTGVKAQIKNMSGQTVYTKTFAKCVGGKAYSFTWDGKKKDGSYADSATYYVSILAGSLTTDSGQVKFNSDFAGGNGSQSNPYQVANLTQLKKVSRHNGCYFVQTADIDGEGSTFAPMFSEDDPFTGSYDGGEHTISYLCFKQDVDCGIFAVIAESGSVVNLKLSSFTYAKESGGDSNDGTIVGLNYGTILNCHVSNSVLHAFETDGYIHAAIGGIAGWNGGRIERCSVEDTEISAVTADAGGITASNGNNGQIIDCVVRNLSLTVDNWENGGGITGWNGSNATVSGCYTEEALSLIGENNSSLGAIVGSNFHGTVTDCYSDSTYDLIG